jgi:hypothetical protein
MSERLELSRPMVRRSAGLQQDGRRRPLGEELEETIAREASFFIDSAGLT